MYPLFCNVAIEVASKFIFGVSYDHISGERYYGLVTRSPKYIPVDEYDKKPADCTEVSPTFCVFWDILTEEWLVLHTASHMSFMFDNIHSLRVCSPRGMATVRNNQRIAVYNNTILDKFNQKRDYITGIANHLREEYGINTSKEDIAYYVSLCHTHHFIDWRIDQYSPITLMMALRITPYKFVFDLSSDLDVAIARNRWLMLISKHANNAKDELNKEALLVDSEAEESEYEIEEIELIKGLIDDAVKESNAELIECSSIIDMLRTWPPILLPQPDFIKGPDISISIQELIKTKLDQSILDRRFSS